MKNKRILAYLLSGTLIFSITGCTENLEETAEIEVSNLEENENETESDVESNDDAENDAEDDVEIEANEDTSDVEETQENESELVTTVDMIDTDDQFTERDLDYSYSDEDVQYIELNNESTDVSDVNEIKLEADDGIVLTIGEEGVYVFSGTLDDGQIVVDCEDDDAKVQIVLDGVSITNDSGPCILGLSADKIFISTESGSDNFLSDTGDEYIQIDELDKNIDGVIFTDMDLTLNGSGSLEISAGYANGIVSKEDLKICGGYIVINSEGKGIEANDSIRIAKGVLNITAGDDGIHTDEDEEEGCGYIYIQDGSITVSSGDDGIHAATAILIENGTITVSKSYEGIEGDTIDILGGTIDITSSDDGLNASTSSGGGFGNFEPGDMDFEFDMDDFKNVSDEDKEELIDALDITEDELDEWLEDPDMTLFQDMRGDGKQSQEDNEYEDSGAKQKEDDEIEPNGENVDAISGIEPSGEENVKSGVRDTDADDATSDEDASSDSEDETKTTPAPDDLDSNMAVNPDGTNAGDEDSAEAENNALKNEESGKSGPGQGGGDGGSMEFSSQDAYIRISGGTVTINASGDGIDSNGDLYIDGGEVYIDGPTNGGNGAIDYGDGDAEGIITGGTVVAIGSSQMAENFSDSSTQYVIMVNLDNTAEAGTEITLKDSSGETVVSYISAKTFDSVVISSPEISTGEYTLEVGDEAQSITVEDIITEVGTKSFGGGSHGNGGHMGQSDRGGKDQNDNATPIDEE